MDDTEDVIRYADPLDAASALTDSINRRALRIARNSNSPQQLQNSDGSWPVTECACGVELVPERLALGRIRCVACQTEHERYERQYGRKRP